MSSPTTAPLPPQTRTDSGAVAALVCGFVSLGGLVFPPLPALGLAGILLGWTSRRRIARSGDELKGNAMAVGGLVLGVLGSLLSLVLPGFVVGVYICRVPRGPAAAKRPVNALDAH
jgi:hypothetical protein